jgi:fatty acid-binding protein DegV
MLANGVVEPYSKARSRSAGMAEIEKAVRALGRAEDIAIMYSTESDEAHRIADKLGDMLPEGKHPLVSRVGPVIGTHAGPRLIAIGHVSNAPGES